MIAWLIAKPWARWLAYGVFGLLVLGVIALRIFRAGKAAEKMQTTLDVLSRGLDARKAAAEVDHSPQAEEHDQNNRDRR